MQNFRLLGKLFLGIIRLVLTQNFPKKMIFHTPLILARTFAQQGFKNASFSVNFVYVLTE